MGILETNATLGVIDDDLSLWLLGLTFQSAPMLCWGKGGMVLSPHRAGDQLLE
ncbi:hypothetical protein [Synechococcus sp. Cruz CV-v-12]|uniref:hypothetical protein n=1 Tax=Synechococcus sp. Cruz CV-v-12 TaxID=2823728 RepID=UPI0037DA422D